MPPIGRRTLSLGTAGLVTATLAGSLLAGCAAQPAQSAKTQTPPASATPAPTQSATPAEPAPDARPRWPLTGELMDDPAAADHAVVAVKVPDNQNEHPQQGIEDADIVFVELDGYPAAVGQSGTRLVPVFHSKYAASVGPVRSIRPVDVALLSPMDAVIGNTGAAAWTIKYFKQEAKGLDVSLNYLSAKKRAPGAYGIDGKRVYTLRGQRYYDHAVVVHPAVLAKASKVKTTPQQLYFPFATGDEQPSTAVSGQPAKTISVPWKTGNSYNMGYAWNAKKKTYLRSMPWGPHVLADGTRVTADNVLVILAKQHFAHHEPFHDLTGKTGTFYYFNGGKYVKGQWSKGEDVDSLFTFTLDDGTPLKMAPGRTFVELPNTTAKLGIKG